MSDNELRESLGKRIEAVESRVRAACARVGRPREDVRLLAVTKTIPDPVLTLLPKVGLSLLGENRPQELWRKATLLASAPQLEWHLIGHLQRNKIERTLPRVALIHSVDSIRLLQALEAAAAQRGQPAHILLEVNTSGEATKHGFMPAEVPGLVPELLGLQSLQVAGLMTMAAPEAEPENCRPCFALLRSLRDQLCQHLPGCTQLSMGMSNDFEVAIEEGSTLVRIGSALFDGLASAG